MPWRGWPMLNSPLTVGRGWMLWRVSSLFRIFSGCPARSAPESDRILPAMPNDAQSAAGVELLELRVLDGPNRFFTRPAVKLDFGAESPGTASATFLSYLKTV